MSRLSSSPVRARYLRRGSGEGLFRSAYRSSSPRFPLRLLPGRVQVLSRAFGLTGAAVLALALFAAPLGWPSPSKPPQAGNTQGEISTPIVQYQPFRRTQSIESAAGGKRRTAMLINLNPAINAWYLLRLTESDGAERVYHLENPKPRAQTFLLDSSHPDGLVISEGSTRFDCELWGSASDETIDDVAQPGVAFSSICGGKAYVRNPTKGHRTMIESVTDFLREDVKGGEQIVVFVRDTFFKSRFREIPEFLQRPRNPNPGAAAQESDPKAPEPALTGSDYSERPISLGELGIPAELPRDSVGFLLGRWYPVKGSAGVYVSAIEPEAIAPEIFQANRNVVSRLDTTEATALDYMVAFDLAEFDLGFALGTYHPKLGWSERVLDRMRDDKLPGPDGIGSPDPLVATGVINPAKGAATAATFTGGFKRAHGAFKFGELAQRNHGSHYGFVEEGVVFSKLQPGLATVFVLDDGSVHMKTWAEADDKLLEKVKYARQNGVPILDFDEVTKRGVPGALVGQWGAGNWSGSEEKKLRTLRAGIALQQRNGRRFLIYGYFSSATPSAMARVFQAYGCDYAMHLDMNALEHTYLAVYRRDGPKLLVQHLIPGMSEVDVVNKGEYVPRFLAHPDNRDFFYLVRREDQR